ncbi:MAG: hypothetical protein R3Y60_00860 [bacterium]
MLNSALDILKSINKEGYTAYIVGGFVRDYLINIKSTDIDIATNMPIDKISQLFNIEIESRHGSFLLNYNNFNFEITLFRKELSYVNHRHPEVEFVSTYKEDYIRRDFTINALAFDYNMDLIDYCNGSNDLSNKTIKTIREPNLTMCEDPVRILRAIYFKNKLNFTFDSKTLHAITNNIKCLSTISFNRLYTELKKVACDFNKYIDDYINLNIGEHIHLVDAINFIYNNKIPISNINDLLIINLYLGNDISKWELNSKVKKDFIKIIQIIKSNFEIRVLFDSDKDIVKEAKRIATLLNLKFNNSELLINSTADIDYDLKNLNNLFDKKEINIIKSNIIDAILNGNLNNNNDDILIYINSLKK